jgi:anthranilate phosphoribosyltransferase/anthranilate synthase/phosphoribosyltransferase
MRPFLARIADGAVLDEATSEAAFSCIMRGEAGEAEIAALLMGLRVRGETAGELVGAIRAMRAIMEPVETSAPVVDLCGTGGDGRNTLNVSTAASFVVAACGVAVAKHGNRAVSSRSGASDVLASLGLDPDPDPAEQAGRLRDLGLAFLHAPRHHPALRHAAAARRAIGTRTILNLAGPLCNPAGARRQLVGVYDPRWLRPMADAMAALGTERAWLVHGDGLDEITLAGETNIVALEDGAIRTFTITPEDAGLTRAPLDTITGGDPAFNAAALLAMLEGRPGAYRDLVLLNAAAVLVIAERAATLREGVQVAGEAVATGAARALLERTRQYDRGMAA